MWSHRGVSARDRAARCSSMGSPAPRRSCAASVRSSRERGSAATHLRFPGTARRRRSSSARAGRTGRRACRTAFDELAAECSDVVVAGQSMGGTLALHLAAHDHRVRAVATLAAPMWLSGPLPPLLPILSHVVRWHRAGDDIDLWNPDAVEELHSYGMRPTRSINELRRAMRGRPQRARRGSRPRVRPAR